METTAIDPPGTSRRLATLRQAAACLAGGLLVGAILSFGSWFALRSVVDDTPSDYELDIPAGTAVLVAQGAAPPSIPSTIRIKDGGSFVIRNRDTVAHRVAEYTIQPGEDREIPLVPAAGDDAQNRFLCSFHPGNVLELSLDEAPPLTANLLPTFAIGLPISLVGFAVLRVTSRLE